MGFIALFFFFNQFQTDTTLLAGEDPVELPALFINEILASNNSTEPADNNGKFRDMIEIFNATDAGISLGFHEDAESFYLSDLPVFDKKFAWRFPNGRGIVPSKGFLVVFCDTKDVFDPIAECELHTSFSISNSGREPITLYGPEQDDGSRPIVDQVWLPPLTSNTSFGRIADGVGPRPVPVDQTLDFFTFNPLTPDSTSPPSFGFCNVTASGNCGDIRICFGSANGPGDNHHPDIERFSQSTNRPEAGEPVRLIAQVRDDKDPLPPNIETGQVELLYRVVRGLEEPGEFTILNMIYDGEGVRDSGIRDKDGNIIGGVPLDRWTLWSAEIPGQPEGVRVEFYLRVTDAEGLSSTSPTTLCEEGIGPCNREFGGFNWEVDNCVLDAEDMTCPDPTTGIDQQMGVRYLNCRTPFTYASGYTPRGDLIHVVINEVVPRQDGLLQDETELGRCTSADNCSQEDQQCCTLREDFIELYNNSEVTVDLSGLSLSDSLFIPHGWCFPEGSKILSNEYLIIWLDNDGGKCPNEPDPDANPPVVIPCFWECPDPTDLGAQEYHTNFSLNYPADQIYLRDTKENNYGIIHGLEFEFPIDPNEMVNGPFINRSMELIPNGDRNGCFIVTEGSSSSPRSLNKFDNNEKPCPTKGPLFIRGDCNGDGQVKANVTDGLFIINFNFVGGTTPPCMAACDANGDGKVTGVLDDGIYLFNFAFLAGPLPVQPYPDCGLGQLQKDDTLGCETSPSICQ